MPIKTYRRIFLIIGLIIAGLIIISGPVCGNQWIYFYDKPISGQVLDSETGKPIEGVVVISMWRLSQFLSQGFGGYAKIIDVITDKDGNFKIPFWITFKPLTFFSSMYDLSPEIIIYKPGYKLYYSHKLERAGFPTHYELSAEKKRIIQEAASLNPAKLKRIYTDEEIWENFSDFESQRAAYEYFTKSQLKIIFKVIENGVFQLPLENKNAKERILKDINYYKQYWVEGKR